MTTASELLIKMCQVPEPQGTDEEIVTEALKAFRSLVSGHQYGGLAYQYKLAKAALPAFERVTDPQPELF